MSGESYDDVRRQLSSLGRLLREIGTALETDPESVIFSNGPAAVRSIRPALSARSFLAAEFPTVQSITTLLERLDHSRKGAT